MKTRSIVIGAALLMAAAAGGFGVYRIGVNEGMKVAASPASTGGAAIAGAQKDVSGARKILYWHDPMVPGQKFDQPGKSPFMDMDLVPVYADDATDPGSTRIAASIQQNLGVRTAVVTRGRIGTVLTAAGSVAWNDRDVALVQARTSGFVERLHVRAPLDPVRSGQPLVDLYVPEWVAAQEEFFSVRRMQGRGLESLVDSARQRMRLAGMSDEQIRLVETGGKVQPRFTITAPIGGVVTELMVREGMTVTAGASLFRINGIGTIWVNAEVPESVAGEVRPGVAVEATTPALPGKIFRGRVGKILPDVNPQTRTIKARIELANPSGRLVPGMFATVSFSPAARGEALLVPTEAVIQTGKRTVVVAALDEGRFAPVDVETGAEANGQTEIRKGLVAGQKVVVSGQFLIDSEASLRATTTRMAEGPGGGRDNNVAGGPTHHGEGKVESIDNDEITLSHGPIPSLKWGPMTMGFRLPAAGLPKNIAVGDSVTFEIREAPGGVYEIVSIARASPPATAKSLPPAKRTDAGAAGAKQ